MSTLRHPSANGVADTSEIQEMMVRDVLAGLSQRPRRLPTKYLYDDRGSQLFEAITELPEYYLTRTELAIYDEHLADMCRTIGPDAWLIELGSGSGRKTMQLLEAMDHPAGYTPIEISPAALEESLQAIRQQLPDLNLSPLEGDFMQDVTLPAMGGQKRVVFFPGSTLGNFEDAQASALLARTARWVGKGGGLLIGVDLVKPREILVPAYSDAQGVTAAFNLNLLARLNREAGADFDLDGWAHRALWNAQRSRMESYLVSQQDQLVHLAGRTFDFARGEAVWTEQSRKYTMDTLMGLAPQYQLEKVWQDKRQWFAVVYLRVG